MNKSGCLIFALYFFVSFDVNAAGYYENPSYYDQQAIKIAEKINTWDFEQVIEFFPLYKKDNYSDPVKWEEELKNFRDMMSEELEHYKQICGAHIRNISHTMDAHLYGWNHKETEIIQIPYWFESEYEFGTTKLYMELILEQNGKLYLGSFSLREKNCKKDSNKSLKHGTHEKSRAP